ncbi:hypothetical protein QFC19_007855 [Naganishia cerealis]|uniref:Uncharacterized protein n=1 Tax=Naganishia cerealis TaxID=610337 RepID=A0ACC2V5V2_9TREE|nr:hypothetical protein QFC19_007855 [Naganishia cerealis]
MAATIRTPLSPAPRYPAPQRPRFNTNPSLGGLHSPHIGSGKGKSSRENNGQSRQETSPTPRLTGLSSSGVPLTGGSPDLKRLPILPDRPNQPTTSISNVQDGNSTAIPMSVDIVPTPSPAISTKAVSGFPLPPFRESTTLPPSAANQPTSSSAATSSSGHASTIDSNPSRIRPLPPRPGPPKPELVPEWEPDVKQHIPEEATLDSRIASYARLSEPPPKLRSQILARERGVATELKEYDRIETKGSAGERRGMLNSGIGTEAASESVEREKLGMLRQPAVNGLVRIEKSANQNSNKTGSMGDMSLKRRGKMRDQAIGMLSDLSGIAGEWVLDPSLPRLGSSSGIDGRSSGGNEARPFLDSKGSATAYSTRTSLSATDSRNSLLPSDQGGHSLHSANSSSMMMVDDTNGSSIWKKRKRISQDASRGKKSEGFPAAVFETDKGNIDVRLAIVNDGARMQAAPRSGSTVMEHYVGSKATIGTARKGLLNARSEDMHSIPTDGSDFGADLAAGETCAKVEILTRKGSVRVELVSTRTSLYAQ